MQIIRQLDLFPSSFTQVVLTVGNFDGMHRGHRAVLQQLKSPCSKDKKTGVITFGNHPSEILRPERPTSLICTLPHRLRLIEEFGIDFTVCLPFTPSLANLSALTFIEQIRKFVPFTDLILGFDATLGKDRQGNRETMQLIAKKVGFRIFYLEQYYYEGNPVSSTNIRNALTSGNFPLVNALLNRPYSIYGTVERGSGTGAKLGFPTANLNVTGLCLPPYGVYTVDMIKDGRLFEGIANLGVAPTIRNSFSPTLEVHLLDRPENEFYGTNVEVIFKTFIRPENRFSDAQELRLQIAKDIRFAKKEASSY